MKQHLTISVILSVTLSLTLGACQTTQTPGVTSYDTDRQSPSVTEKQAFNNCPMDSNGRQLQVFEAARWNAHRQMHPVLAKTFKGSFRKNADRAMVLISVGLKPTVGHSIAIDEPLRLKGSTLTIPATFNKPKPGLRTGAALSSPCVYLQIAAAPWTQIDLVDARSGVLMQRWTR